LNEAREQRVAVARIRRELGMELRGEEPRMRRQLDELDETVTGKAREDESRIRDLVEIAVVEFVAVPVPLRDLVFAVDLLRERAILDVAGLRAEAHRATEIRSRGTRLQRAVTVVPLRNQR